MSTRSSIGIMRPDNTIQFVYCHFDGYTSHNGKILVESYTDRAKIEELLALGALSSLAENIGTKHDFDNAPKDECNFYTRDRGEPANETCSETVYSIAMYDRQEYNYVFMPDNKWYVKGDNYSTQLSEVIVKNAEESVIEQDRITHPERFV